MKNFCINIEFYKYIINLFKLHESFNFGYFFIVNTIKICESNGDSGWIRKRYNR